MLRIETTELMNKILIPKIMKGAVWRREGELTGRD
jgi:hypothetical protein